MSFHRWLDYSFILATVALSVYGQLVLKWRMDQLGPMPAGFGGGLRHLLWLLIDPVIFSTFVAAFFASLAWMAAMTRFELSYAYPFTSLNFAAVLLLSAALLGGVQDRILWRPLRKKGTGLIAMLVVTIGLALLARGFFLYLFGGSTAPFNDYQVQEGYDLGPVSLAPKDLISMLLCIAMLLAVAYALLRTRIGKATRAVSDNPALAASSGIDVERVISTVWVAGAGLAALAGILLALAQQVSFQLGFQILLLVFAGVTLGGLGTAFGALVGSLVVGIFTQVSTIFVPTELKNAGALVVLILILLVRPQGILGQSERVG